MLFQIILAIVIISLISLVGVFTLSLNKLFLHKILLILVSFAAGTLLGDVFIHLLPEVTETYGFGTEVSFSILAGILVFYIVESFISWNHCHKPNNEKHTHPLAIMNLVGDGVHNFLDGMIIASSFLLGAPLGIATTIAVAFHEIPQEIGDFGVLIYGGYSKTKALMLNFAVSLTAILGGVVTYYIGTDFLEITKYLVPFAAGGFIYIASADIIPELHKEKNTKKIILQLIFFVLGIAVMYALTMFE